MPKISLQMYTLRDYTKTMGDLDKTLQKLREIGFDTLQYSIPDSFDPKEVKKLFDNYGICDDSVFCPQSALAERTEKIIGMCELFGTSKVRIDSIPRNLSASESGYREFASYLNNASSDLAKHGIKLLYHFHTFEFIRFGSKTGIGILLEETSPDVLELNPDTHWIQSGGYNPSEYLKNHRDRYEYMHCKDYSVCGMGEKWESYPIIFAPVGEGNLDWDGILGVCRDTGVKICAIEQDDCYGRDVFECVKSSYDFLKKKGLE